MTTAADPPIVPRPPAAAPALHAADQARHGAQWRLFNDWCDLVGLRALPAEPLTVARYLAVRAGSGASVATLRLATSAIARVHRWAGHESPGRDRGVREALQGWGRRLARPQRQAGALTADVLSVIRLTAPKPRARGRGMETPAQAAVRARFDFRHDQLARSVPDARAIADRLQERGVKLALGRALYDPGDPMGKMFFNILATFAEFEADLIRMRTREGMTIARARGKLRGKQPKLSDRQQRELCRMHATGEYSISDLAELFSVSRPTVYRTLNRRLSP